MNIQAPPADPIAKEQKKADPLELRAQGSSVSRLSRKAILSVGAFFGMAISIALAAGIWRGDIETTPKTDPSFQSADPARLNELPTDYAHLGQPPILPGAKDPEATGPLQPAALIIPPIDKPSPSHSTASPGQTVDPDERARLARLAQEREAAAKADVFFTQGIDQGAKRARQESTQGRQQASSGVSLAEDPLHAGLPADNAQNLQPQKLAFIDRNSTGQEYLGRPYRQPLSRYEVKAGNVIPAALITGINSDLPGDIVAQVTDNVYDTVTGRALLIPQGTRLIGKYDSFVAFGQSRALVVWQRLIMPNGRSILLDGMIGADRAGYSGLEDEVDYHLKQLGLGVVLSTALSLGGNLAVDDRDDNSILGDAALSVSQEASRTGQQVVRKFLNVQPTITIRPGWPLNVMVNKDIILAAYDPKPVLWHTVQD